MQCAKMEKALQFFRDDFSDCLGYVNAKPCPHGVRVLEPVETR